MCVSMYNANDIAAFEKLLGLHSYNHRFFLTHQKPV